MKTKISLTSVLLAATMLISSPILAADGSDMPFAEQQTDAPASQNEAANNPALTSGGVGEEEMSRLKSIQNQYNLKLLITERNGTFLSDIDVHIIDSKGNEVAETTTEGPVLLAKLPVGKYKIRAERHEEVKEQKVTVTGKGLSAYLISFRDTTERDSGDPRSTSLK